MEFQRAVPQKAGFPTLNKSLVDSDIVNIQKRNPIPEREEVTQHPSPFCSGCCGSLWNLLPQLMAWLTFQVCSGLTGFWNLRTFNFKTGTKHCTHQEELVALGQSLDETHTSCLRDGSLYCYCYYYYAILLQNEFRLLFFHFVFIP